MYAQAEVIMSTTIDVLAFVISVTLILSVLMGSNRGSKWNRYFLRLLTATAVISGSEAISWLADGKPTLRLLSLAANFILFTSGYLVLIAMADYLFEYMQDSEYETSDVRFKAARYGVYILAALGIFMVCLNQFTRIIYWIDADNVYHRGFLFPVAYLLEIMIWFIFASLVLRNRKHFGADEGAITFAYLITPPLSCILQLAHIPLFNAGTAVAVVMLYIGMHSRINARLANREMELMEQKIIIMQSQIQPHFLCNTLLTIRDLCDTDPTDAGVAVEEFTEYLRYNFEYLNQSMVPFPKLMHHMEIYLNLMRRRSRKKIQLIWDIQESDFSLPPLSLQPLVENAVLHGILPKKEGGTIWLSTRGDEKGIQITIRDDGVGFDPDAVKATEKPVGKVTEKALGKAAEKVTEKAARKAAEKAPGKVTDKAPGKASGKVLEKVTEKVTERVPGKAIRGSGLGIGNVKKRLELRCGGTLELHSKPGEGTTVIIKIPHQTVG
jgi:glucose-6-phosphate-specific signal transduction histidine kinase